MILNGAPRSGKSTIARALQARADGEWVNLGVDQSMRSTPAHLLPGIGLRPGGERSDLEPFIVRAYAALYDSVIAHADRCLDVVVDVGHHDSYSAPLHILPNAASRLVGRSAWIIGVRCPIETIMQRRDNGDSKQDGTYLTTDSTGAIPEPVLWWQQHVHDPGIYDLEVDTSSMSPTECWEAIAARIDSGPPSTALLRLAALAPADPDR